MLYNYASLNKLSRNNSSHFILTEFCSLLQENNSSHAKILENSEENNSIHTVTMNF